jgi:hypothetical protein
VRRERARPLARSCQSSHCLPYVRARKPRL